MQKVQSQPLYDEGKKLLQKVSRKMIGISRSGVTERAARPGCHHFMVPIEQKRKQQYA